MSTSTLRIYHPNSTACTAPIAAHPAPGAPSPHVCSVTALRACPCVAPLRTPYDPARERGSGFRNVYASHSAVYPWVAKVKIGGRLREVGRACLPHQAAVYVARWYRERFGDGWAQEVGRRKRPKSWRVMRLPGDVLRRGGQAVGWVCWRAVESAEDGGWLLFVYEWDAEVCVREVKRGRSGRWTVPRPLKSKPGTKPRGRVKVFASRDAAAEYVLVWLIQRWGLFAFLAGRRG